MADVQFTRHIWRRDRNDEGLDTRVEVRVIGIVVRLELFSRFPHRINARLSGFEIVGFR